MPLLAPSNRHISAAVLLASWVVLPACGSDEGPMGDAAASSGSGASGGAASGGNGGAPGGSTASSGPASSSSGGPMGNPTLQAIPGNTALDLGAYVCDQPADNPGGCAHITDYGKLVYDATAHQLLMWGGGHAGNYASNVMRFDLSALAWGAEYASTTCANQVADNFDPVTASWKDTQSPTARHTWDMMSIAEVNGARSLVILTSGGIGGYESCSASPGEPVPASGKTMSYGIDGKAWSFGTTAADSLWYYASAQETDPVSGQVLVLATWPSLELYDPDSGEVANVAADFSAIDVNDLGYSNNLVYFPPNDRFAERFKRLEIAAARQGRGLWSACES